MAGTLALLYVTGQLPAPSHISDAPGARAIIQISFSAYSQMPGGGEPVVLHPDPHCLHEEVSVWDRRYRAVCEQ